MGIGKLLEQPEKIPEGGGLLSFDRPVHVSNLEGLVLNVLLITSCYFPLG